ncbi:MAG: lipase family protein [Bryobacteraceae bacterium]
MPFVKQTSGISLKLARVCVQASADAYEHVTFESELAHVLVGNAECGMGSGKATELSLRGSANTPDWLTDLRAGWTETPCGRVHIGFWCSVDSIFHQVVEVVKPEPQQPIIIDGHSKGGGESVILALRLARMGFPIMAVHTFGGPRVADAAWKAAYNAQSCNLDDLTLGDVTYRWVHEEDIVPRIPPWISGRRHVGHECFMSSLGGVELDPPIWRLAASDILGTFWGYRLGRIEQVADHPVAKYREHLEKL